MSLPLLGQSQGVVDDVELLLRAQKGFIGLPQQLLPLLVVAFQFRGQALIFEFLALEFQIVFDG
jgi:hypothetical protein